MIRSLASYFSIAEHYVESGLSPEKAIAASKAPREMTAELRNLLLGRQEVKTGGITIPRTATDEAKQIACGDSQATKEGLFLPRYWDALHAKRIPTGRIRTVAKEIVSRLPNPAKCGKFLFKGLVVGHVQSGKTANMGGIICRAAEYGYNLVIVLSGIYNDLRKQTQERFETDLIQPEKAGNDLWETLTGRDLDGDFRRTHRRHVDPNLVSLAVVKKRVTTLRTLIDWISRMPEPERSQLNALIIDDEADQASIDTNYEKRKVDPDEDPAKTNDHLRKLLIRFPKVVYLGFTATPMANVFIQIDDQNDLYPRDLIYVLDEPEGYFGAGKLFGFGAEHGSSLDVIRIIPQDDAEKVRKEGNSGSLEDAVLSFVLATAARDMRTSKKEHATMLVHGSHQKANHEVARKCIEEIVKPIKAALKFSGFQQSHSLKRARQIWEEDFRQRGKAKESFKEVWGRAAKVAEDLKVMKVNSASTDILDYPSLTIKDAERKIYIAVGGNRLSRGLTLEGLLVSYFVRMPQTSDTLMQMGRWFGYREGYVDLTRIYVEKEMSIRFCDMALDEQEFREDLRKYMNSSRPISPTEVAPRIRQRATWPVVARSKMGAATQLRIGLENTSTQVFEGKDGRLLDNKAVVSDFLATFSKPPAKRLESNEVIGWSGVKKELIANLFDKFEFSPLARVMAQHFGKVAAHYIKGAKAPKAYASWDLVVVAGAKKNRNRDLGPLKVSPSSRRKRNASALGNTIQSLKSSSQDRELSAWRSLCRGTPDRPTILLYPIKFSDSPMPKDGFDVVGMRLDIPESCADADASIYLGQYRG